MKKWFIFIILIGLVLSMINYNLQKKTTLIFSSFSIPFSSDPIDYDYYVHHYSFGSVLGKLVSSEKNGEYQPMLAEEWKNYDDHKTWEFKLRKNLMYSNGDSVDPQDIYNNFKRIIYLKKTNQSKSGLVEFLKGFDDLDNLQDEMTGIKIEGNKLIFEFIKPMPNLLDLVSFGFYALAHPSLYDNQTGVWKDKKKIISSGPYEVTKWTQDEYELKLRENLPYLDYKNRVKNIKFVLTSLIKESSDLKDIDIIIADKKSLLVNDEFHFYGPENSLKIGYVHCFTWNNPNKKFHNIEIRRWFRKKFYDGFAKNNFPITNSFFPVALNGISQFALNYDVPKPSFEHFLLETHPLDFSVKLKENEHKMSTAEYFRDALLNLGDDSGATLSQKDDIDSKKYDVSIKGTGIESNNYIETVKFMFLSKDGIKLPDATGIIIAELNKENPDINIINKELWDQAIIWPIRHYSSGYWIKNSSGIDHSEVNLESATIDFQFFKWK